MKQTIYVLLMFFSLYMGAGQGQEIVVVTTVNSQHEINPYALPSSGNEKGFLEKTKLAVGALIKSHHFKKYEQGRARNKIESEVYYEKF